VEHELVVAFQAILLNADDRAVIRNTDEQIAALGIQECRNSLQSCVRDSAIVLLVVLETPTQSGLELQGLRLSAFDQFLCVAMRLEVLVEQQVLDGFTEGAVIGDALVEVEVGVGRCPGSRARLSGRTSGERSHEC